MSLVERIKKNLKLISVLFVLAGASYFLYRVGLKISPEQVRFFVAQFGILGPIVYIVLVILSIVVAPISGIPIWIGGFFAFGIPLVIILNWVGGNFGGALAFLIARKWGRPVVRKLVGIKALSKIDEISQDIGIITLFILRIFQATLFDLVSYGAGLTNISFKGYLIATVVGTIITAVLFLSLYNTLTDYGWQILSIIGVWGILGWILASIPPIWFFLKRTPPPGSNR